METIQFYALNFWYYYGHAVANSSLVIQNTSNYPLQFFLNSAESAVPASDTGFILKPFAAFTVECHADTHVYIKNAHASQTKQPSGVISMSNPKTFAYFLMSVTSPTLPTLIDVAGGTITTVDNGDGTFTFESFDNITHFKFDVNKADITKVEFFYDSLTNLNSTFADLTNMTEFIANTTSFKNVTDCYAAWGECISLTNFPLIDLRSATNLEYAWYNCSSLISFPLTALISATTVFHAWFGCSSLTNFPLIDLRSATNFTSAWDNCSSLVSFAGLNFSSLTVGGSAFLGCTALTQPPPTGTDVRNGDYATQGTWIKP